MADLIKNRWREKLKEAIVFFSGNVDHPTKTMMLKLLAELDFRNFKVAGETVTNLEYFTWDYGPVPKTFFNEISVQDDMKTPEDFKDALTTRKDIDSKNNPTYYWIPRRKPNLKKFSPRQQQLLKDIAMIYKHAKPSDSTKASHEIDTAWNKTLKLYGKYKPIDLFEVLDTKQEIKKRGLIKKQNLAEFVENFGLQSHVGDEIASG